jgi:hypothetical protein
MIRARRSLRPSDLLILLFVASTAGASPPRAEPVVATIENRPDHPRRSDPPTRLRRR